MRKPRQSHLAAGLDLGTSGCRAVVLDSHRQPLAWGRQAWPHGGMPDCPDQWQQTALATLTQTCAEFSGQIECLAIDGTSGSVLLTDRDGLPLTRGMPYNEPAEQRWSDLINRLAPTASGAHGSSSGLARALQLATEAELVKDFQIHSQADWVAASLCADFSWCDENNALKLGYDPVNRCWPEWLNQLAIPPTAYPKVFPAGTPIAPITPAKAANSGLVSTCRIVTGTTDSIAGLLAAGADQPGEAVTSLGTTLALKLLSPTPTFSPQHGVYSHRLGQHYLTGGASNCGAGILTHFFTPEQLEELSSRLDPEHDTGLCYYPLLHTGERFPHHDPRLQPHLEPRPSSDAEFLQGLLEGLARVEAEGYRLLQELGAPRLKRVVSVGGGATNQAWLRIRQRYLDVPVISATQTEAAFGAALLAHRCIQ